MPDTIEIRAEAFEEMQSTLKQMQDALEKRDQEREAGGETAETKAQIERMQDRIDELEANRERANEELKGKGTQADDGVELTPDPEVAKVHRKAFFRFLRTKGRSGMPEDFTAKAAMRVDDEDHAGLFVPDDFRSEIIKAIVEQSPVRELVGGGVQPTSGNSVSWPRRTGRPTVTWPNSEVGPITDGNGPSYGTVKVEAEPNVAFVDITNSLLRLSDRDLAAVVRDEIAETMSEGEATKFVSGDGNGVPKGFLEDFPTVDTATNDTYTVDDLITQFYTLKAGYRRNAVWGLHDTIIRISRQEKGSTSGEYLWQPGLTASDPSTILGRPYRSFPDLASAVADGAKISVLADWQRAYKVVDGLPLTVMVDPYTQGTAMTTRYLFSRETGGGTVLPEAGIVLKVA